MMLYFLGIVDTIEPVKTYKDENPVLVLQHVHFSFPHKRLMEIKIDGTLDPQRLIKRATGLDSWLDVGFTSESDGITICFKLGT
jgi:hypothetical protein